MSKPNSDTETVFEPGDTVRIVLPDPNGVDAEYDGKRATVIGVSWDHMSSGFTEADFHSLQEELEIDIARGDLDAMYKVKLENGVVPGVWFRVHDLRPIDE